MSNRQAERDEIARTHVELSDTALCDINHWWTVSRIVTNVAHDLNNAFQVISGTVELMKAAGTSDPTVARRLTALEWQADRVAKTVKTLLTYARGDERHPQMFDVAELAALALSFRSMSLGRAHITAALKSPDDALVIVQMNRALGLQLLITALLDAEHHLAGYKSADLVLRVTREDEGVGVSVESTGQGERSDAAIARDDRDVESRLSEQGMHALAALCGATVRESPAGPNRRITIEFPLVVPA